MTTRTQYFDDPIIRIGIENTRFPRMCPICGQNANRITKVMVSPVNVTHPGYRTSQKARLLHPATKSLLVYVCDDHYQSDEGMERSKFLCALANGIFISLLIFGFITTGGDLWNGRPIHPLFLATIGLFTITLLLSIPTFRAGPLESAVRIIGTDASFRNIWIQFQNGIFRDRFIQDNAMDVELVKWIRKI